jgi:protein ImuB
MFATIFVPNFYLQAALRHQLPHRSRAVPAVGPAGTLSASRTDSSPGEPAFLNSPEEMLQPVALIDEKENKPLIIQLNPAAEAAGVHKGMTPSQGLARCLTLLITTRSPTQEKSMQEIVLHYAFSLSPYVEVTGLGVYTLQFTNDRDLPRKVSRVIDQLAASEITAQGGLAQTPDTSFLAAYLAQPVLEIKDPKKFLAPLPIDTLAIPLQF